jgi:MATE family multidrug resistance protein
MKESVTSLNSAQPLGKKSDFFALSNMAFPIFLGMLSNTFMQLIDTWAVSSQGPSAVGAVGATGFIHFIFSSLIVGASTGMQTFVAHMRGSGNEYQTPALRKAVKLRTASFAFLLAVGLALGAHQLLVLMNWDPEFIRSGSAYLSILGVSLFFTGLSSPDAGILYAFGQGRTVFRITVCVQIIDTILSYFMVNGTQWTPSLGVKGAAIGTLVAIVLGACLNSLAVNRLMKPYRGAETKDLRVPSDQLLSMREFWSVSLNSSISQVVLALSWVCFYKFTDKSGLENTAFLSVLSKVSQPLTYFGISLGIACNTFVSRDLGAKTNPSRWVWIALSAKIPFFMLLLVVLYFTEHIWVKWAIVNEMDENSKYIIFAIYALTIFWETFAIIFSRALNGFRKTKELMLLNVVVLSLWFASLSFVQNYLHAVSFQTILASWAFSKFTHSVLLLLLWRKSTKSWEVAESVSRVK